MKSIRRLWEIKPSTICKMLGTALDTKDVNKLARKFHITNGNNSVDDELAFHSALVEFCQSNNEISRQTDKILRRRYEAYASKLSEMDAESVLKTLRQSPESFNVPLWAVLWSVATSEEGEKYEPALFGFVHLLEHRLVRQYWKELAGAEKRELTAKQKTEEFRELKKQLLEARREIELLRKSNLRIEQKLLASQRQPQGSVSSDEQSSGSPCSCVCKNKQKIVALKQMLEEERSRSRAFQNEIALFRNEIDGLMAEFAIFSRNRDKSECGDSESACPIGNFLNGMSVAMVGGIESLEKHYRQLIESMGGSFNRHDGYCRGGQDSLEEVISQADFVVCPVEVNSHNAARFTKKICKAKGIPCCFVKSASLASLKRTVEASLKSVNAA